MTIKHIGNAVFIDTDPVRPDLLVSPKKGPGSTMRWNPKKKDDARWMDAMEKKGLAIYPYVEWPNLENAYVGLALAQKRRDKYEIIEKTQVDHMGYNEPRTPLVELRDLDEQSRYIIEDIPFVEIESEEQFYDLVRLNNAWYRDDKSHSDKWVGPGIYDAREMDRAYESQVAYELADLENESVDVIDFMFQDDKWEESFGELLEEMKKYAEEEA